MVDLRGRDPCYWSVSAASTIREFFATRGKHVIYFGGYGELGYEHPGRVRAAVETVLSGYSANDVLVYAATMLRLGGHDGIAQIFPLAQQLGFETVGVHPSVAMGFSATHRVSSACDHVFFVADQTWGGFLPGTAVPSPTLRLHLAVSDEIVMIGGGHHAADELRAFAAAGLPARYFPAEMNRAAVRDWCARSGVSVDDPRGAAYTAWRQLRTPTQGPSGQQPWRLPGDSVVRP